MLDNNFEKLSSNGIIPKKAAKDIKEKGTFNVKEIEVIEKSLKLHESREPMKILQCFGGREFAAIFGAILAARFERIPVILDGFPVCAAAALLHAISSDALDHCYVSHLSSEPGHERLLERINKKPLVDFKMRLGEGSGAACPQAARVLSGRLDR